MNNNKFFGSPEGGCCTQVCLFMNQNHVLFFTLQQGFLKSRNCLKSFKPFIVTLVSLKLCKWIKTLFCFSHFNRASLKVAAVSNVSLTVFNSPPRVYGTISSETGSIQVQNQTGGNVNVTYLLNNLLKQYDNSLRPDLGGNHTGVRS